MARTKKTESEPVRIRFKKLKNGGQSIYLDIYVNGKRSYEFLKLSLIPENTPEDREQNEHTMKAANAVKAQRTLDLANNKPSVALSEKAKLPLIEWLQEYKEDRLTQGRSDLSDVDVCIVYLKRYNTNIKMCDVDADFINDFVEFMYKQKNRRTGAPLAKKTISSYVGVIRAALNYAVENEHLSSNPTLAFDWNSIKGEQSKREYLTIEEVEKLINTPYRRDDVRLPFLFACFCGLRVSDIRRLTWKDIIYEGDKARVEVVQKKTGRSLYLPLSNQALKFLPKEQGEPNDPIFNVPDLHIVGHHLKLWADAAGVNKKITMHVGRHTFATMTLTTGTDLYTTSQLLGHSDIETTQVYGKIVDTKKQQAVFLIDELFDEELYS
jgi:integrase